MNRRKEIEEFIEKFQDIPEFVHTIRNKEKIYYSGPYYDKKELIEIINSVMFGKWFSSGEKVEQFEKKFSLKFNQKHSVMVSSGSSANLLMIAALKKYFGWKDNDEIIISSVGFPTTLSAILVNNLKPVFVDIEFETLNFNIDELKKKINNKTKAIFISPVLGNPPNFDQLVEINKNNKNIQLVLDNCDSLGSMWDNKYLSDYVVASSCSFYPAHHLTTGEGGMISSNIYSIVKIARSMAWWGRDCECIGAQNLLSNGTCKKRFNKWINKTDLTIDHKYYFTNFGFNLKPLDLQGALGLAQLKKFDEIETKRIDNKYRIQGIIQLHLDDVIVVDNLSKAHVSWFGVPIICLAKGLKTRLVKHLEENNIQTRNYFAGNILMHPAYEHLDDWKKYPSANQVLERVFFLGCAPHYTHETFKYINKVMQKF